MTAQRKLDALSTLHGLGTAAYFQIRAAILGEHVTEGRKVLLEGAFHFVCSSEDSDTN